MSAPPERSAEDYDSVGPVLRKNALGEVVLEAILTANPGAKVIDRGAYLRVLVPGRCTVTRATIEQRAGRSFRWPGELEQLMPSFKGLLTIDGEGATWAFHER